MNLKLLASLFIILMITSLLMFSPKGREFREKSIKNIGSFLKTISGRISSSKTTPSPRLDVMITKISPVYIQEQTFTIKDSGFKGELWYDSIALSGGDISFPTNKIVVNVNSMTGVVSFEGNRLKVSGSTNRIELNEMTYNMTDIRFSIIGTPVSYTLKDVKKDRIVFQKISGSLSWSGLKGVPPLLRDDRLELIEFDGIIIQENDYVSITGKVGKIRLNGVDIGLSS